MSGRVSAKSSAGAGRRSCRAAPGSLIRKDVTADPSPPTEKKLPFCQKQKRVGQRGKIDKHVNTCNQQSAALVFSKKLNKMHYQEFQPKPVFSHHIECFWQMTLLAGDGAGKFQTVSRLDAGIEPAAAANEAAGAERSHATPSSPHGKRR